MGLNRLIIQTKKCKKKLKKNSSINICLKFHILKLKAVLFFFVHTVFRIRNVLIFYTILFMFQRLKLTGYFLYECVPVKVAYNEWFEILDLPDTFASWFTITELHVWLLLVRYMAEDVTASSTQKKKYVKGDGHFVRNCIIEALWADVANRIKLLDVINLIYIS